MENELRFMVSIHCMTYNQAAYITDALNGFAMQRIDFPFLALVFDDASTDGEQEVIKDYLTAHFDHSEETGYKQWETEDACYTFARHQENENCFFMVALLKKNLYRNPRKGELIKVWDEKAKYIALCEGDDYWTDPLKLQKQVDFLEEHEEYSMCFHKVDMKTDVLGERPRFTHLEERDYTSREIYEIWTVPTCSVVYRNGRPFETHPAIVYGDIFIFLQLAERGKLRCLNFVGGVYRRHEGSASCGYLPQTEVRLFHQYKYMQKRFPELSDISKRNKENELEFIIYAPYFSGIWKYRFRYMFRHPKLFFTSFFTTTILSYTPIKDYKIWKKRRQ